MTTMQEVKAAWNDGAVYAGTDPRPVFLAQSYKHWRKALSPARAWDMAKIDADNGKRRFPEKVKPTPAVHWEAPKRSEHLAYVTEPDRIGLRLVGRVQVNPGDRGKYWDDSERTGYFTEPDGDSDRLIYGVVYQLPGRKGHNRFVAGYGNTDDESFVVLDFGMISEESSVEMVKAYSNDGYFPSWNDNPRESDAARTAARWADGMADHEAEEERYYNAAWRAGSIWSDLGEEIADERREALTIMGERREAKRNGAANYPALCIIIRSRLDSILESIREKRETRAKLARGDYYSESAPGFYFGDDNLRGAFNDGAGEMVI